MQRVVVTGGAGFIGSAIVRRLLATTTAAVCIVDKLTYAARRETIAAELADPRVTFHQLDIGDARRIEEVFSAFGPDTILNLAAETHVDRSIGDASPFVATNITGTHVLLEAACRRWQATAGDERAAFRYVQISTDEVYGALGATGRFTEASLLAPNSPYAASKAAADHLVQAWHNTYGLPTTITRCSNNYGPYQFPEKLIPLMVTNALAGKPLPIYGNGRQVRDWIHVEDHAAGVLTAATRGRPGAVYNLGADCERANIDLVRTVCGTLDDLRPDPAGPYARLITHVTDRLGHDVRYAIDPTTAARDLGWRAGVPFDTGLRETVAWYVANRDWWSSRAGT